MLEEFGINAGFVEDLHAQYRQSPQSVEEHWRTFFEGFDRGEHANGGNGAALVALVPAAKQPYTNGNGAVAAAPISSPSLSLSRDERLLAAAALQGRVYQLVNAYRVRG